MSTKPNSIVTSQKITSTTHVNLNEDYADEANMSKQKSRKRISVISLAALAFVVATAAYVYCQTANPSFVISISAQEMTFQSGLPIRIHITIENRSDKPLLFESGRPFGGDSGIIVKDSNSSIVEPILAKLDPKLGPLKRGGFGYGILPGKSYTEIIDARTHYDLSTPGQYTIQVQHMDHETNQLVTSNALKMTIMP